VAVEGRRRPRPALTREPSAPAPATKGLDPLDRDRAGSLADEGGAAGARVEGPRGAREEEDRLKQAEPTPRPDPDPDPRVPPEGDEPERPQERRLPGKDEIPAFDDSGDTPAIPSRVRPAARGDGRE
jgi:hypothetical protein